MDIPINEYTPVLKECEGCCLVKPRVFGDNDLICCRHINPYSKWWYDKKCEDYRVDECDWSKYECYLKD